MYSDETAAKAIATLGILLHDTPLEDTHPDLAAQVRGVLALATADEMAMEQHMDSLNEPEFDTILVDDPSPRKYVLKPELTYSDVSKGENHD
jgi:hypothetical protein